MDNRYKVIAIMGKSGAGKDTLLKSILQNPVFDINEIISYTTRPIRENERDGIDYYFLTKDNFQKKIENNEMLEYSFFNTWYYGTGIDALSKEKINVGVFNPTGVRSLLKNKSLNVKIYYVTADDKTRLLRQLTREAHPNIAEIIRRYNTDEMDFSNLSDIPYIEIKNNLYEDIPQNIEKIVSNF